MTLALRAGDVVVGKYRIARQIGSGGMGVVFAATHLQLGEPVALKFLVESALEPAIAAERFLREARATFRLRSEHTVRVMDVGTLPTGEPFMVMELLVGKDLKELLAERGPLPPGEAALYMTQICAALQEAHALGIVHRDLKARNLFLTTRVDGTPCIKVLDFGISKLSAEADAAPLTQANMGMGSPRYMAPEQWTSASTVDARADIYAAGAVFYECLTGVIPLDGLPLVEVIKRIRAGAVPSPKVVRPDLPDPVCRVVMRALRPRPEERFPTAMHLAQAIRDAVPDVQIGAKPKPVLGLTAPTAVVNREAMLARARIDEHLARAALSSAPTPKERPRALGEEAPASSTLDEGVPAACAPGPSSSAPSSEDDPATLVTQSPFEAEPAPRASPVAYATLQVAEAPPELQALRTRPAAAPIVSAVPPQAPAFVARPAPAAPPAPPPQWNAAMAMPIDETINDPSAALPSTSRPRGWLFWLVLVLSCCAVGAVAAAVLTRLLG